MAQALPIAKGSIGYRWRNGSGSSNAFINVPLPVSSGYATALAIGQLVFLSSGNLQVCTAGSAVLGILQGIVDEFGVPFRDGYRPASVAASAIVLPAALVDFSISEDAVADVINYPTDTHVDIAAQTILGLPGQPYAPMPVSNTLLDSSTAAGSAGALTFQILGPVASPENVRPAGNTTSPLTYWVRPVSSLLQTA